MVDVKPEISTILRGFVVDELGEYGAERLEKVLSTSSDHIDVRLISLLSAIAENSFTPIHYITGITQECIDDITRSCKNNWEQMYSDPVVVDDPGPMRYVYPDIPVIGVGDTVYDKITGIKGVITEKITLSNGDISYTADYKIDQEGVND